MQEHKTNTVSSEIKIEILIPIMDIEIDWKNKNIQLKNLLYEIKEIRKK